VGAAQQPDRELMQISGTSMAAPVVAGAAALMLQANPGLTPPPCSSAILQYAAQPLAGAPLAVQGTGMVDVEGAVRLARALRTDIGPALEAGTLAAGGNMLAPGASRCPCLPPL
jgi:subtilisin family serine protease